LDIETCSEEVRPAEGFEEVLVDVAAGVPDEPTGGGDPPVFFRSKEAMRVV
jgi:hypothetical protein